MLENPNINKDLVQLSSKDSLRKALNAFKSFKISHLPVIEGGRLIGIVTKTNVSDYIYGSIEEFSSKNLGQFLEETKVDVIMGEPVATVQKNDELWDIVNRLQTGGIGSVVVKDGDSILGILTERDFLQVIREALDNNKGRSEIIMSKIKEALFSQNTLKQEGLFSEIGI